MNRHHYFAVTASLAFALGCSPTARGGAGAVASAEAGESSARGAGGESMQPTDQGGSGGDARVAPTADRPSDPEPAPSCDVCSSALAGSPSDPLCGPSQTAFDSLLGCACTGGCAAVCGSGAAGNCLDAWAGNPPLECKTCLISATGCGAAWNACLADDGVTPPGDASSSSGGSTGTCDPALKLCPGGGSCATPGPYDGAGNAACGSAEYCAPCCDPGNAGASQGACQTTKSDQAPCAQDYECCSGTCTAGKCDGGCGIIFSF